MNASTKTLVIRFSSIGDIILATPLLRALRRRFPKGQIDFVTRKEYAELVKNNHNLNFTYEFDVQTGFEGLRQLKRRIREESYDLIVDIHDSLRSKYLRSMRGVERAVVNKRLVQRTALVKLKKNLYKNGLPVPERYIEAVQRYGVENDEKGLELHIPDEVLFGVSGKIAALRLHRFEKTIGLCPGARHFTKRWPRERYAELAAKVLHTVDAKLLLFGGLEDRGSCSFIHQQVQSEGKKERVTDFSGELSLLETAAAMQYCDVVVTNDSGLMHMASAMQRKIVALFGSTVREFGFYPYRAQATVLEEEGLSCRPCSHIGRPACPEEHFRCMMDISVERVHNALLRQLDV
jgi:heptosyltransferase-2